MFIFLIIVGSLLGYTFIAGALRAPFSAYQISHCEECNNGRCKETWRDAHDVKRTRDASSKTAHSDSATCKAFFWPLTLPWHAGAMISGFDKTGRKELKAVTRRSEEIAEAKHQAELAEIRANEDAHLTRQLQDR